MFNYILILINVKITLKGIKFLFFIESLNCISFQNCTGIDCSLSTYINEFMKKKGRKIDTSANTNLVNEIIKNTNSAIIKNNL